MPQSMVPRHVAELAHDFLRSFRVVIINGPRQSGKTTLLKDLSRTEHGTYRTLDDGPLRSAARADPAAFVDSGSARPLMIDEVQRGGDDLVLAIKAVVDRWREPGQFVLAGSTRFLSTPSLSESLAGRAGVLDVWPFAQQELAGRETSFLTTAFTGPDSLREAEASAADRQEYLELICRGSYPEAIRMRSQRTWDHWYRTYVQAIIDTDIREMARVEEPSGLQQLLHLVAANTSQELNTQKAGSDLGLHRTTVNRYLGLLETVFLVRSLQPWSRGLAARAVRRPKLHLTDSGLAAHLLGVDADSLAANVAPARGPLMETFVINELAKQASWSPFPVRLYHWRVSQGPEVDLVLERSNGGVVGIEVKATMSVRLDDFKGLSALRDRLGEPFVHGFVFYAGPHTLSFGDRLTALPISALWDR